MLILRAGLPRDDGLRGDARHGVCYKGADSCLLCELAEGILAPDKVLRSRSTSCTNWHNVTEGRGSTANQAGRRRCALPDWGSRGSAQGPRASQSARSRRVPGFCGEEEPERSRRRSASLPLLVASARPVERHAGRATLSKGPFNAARPRVSSALIRERRRRSMSISSGLRAPGRWHHRPWGSRHARRLLAGLAVSWLRRARVSVSPGPPPRPLASRSSLILPP
ncbi:hypothetical protein M432DRAFT_653292 [Thermoascus aurantiacus ATCC 26904]